MNKDTAQGTAQDSTRTPDGGAPPPGTHGGDIRQRGFAPAAPESNVGPPGAAQTSNGSKDEPIWGS